MRIGVDLDNTIISYDELFSILAIEQQLVSQDFIGGKTAVRATLRARGESGEEDWRRLQALAYGEKIERAAPMAGALETLAAAAQYGHELYIVSHKTEHAYGSFFDLRGAARTWLQNVGLLTDQAGPIRPSNLYFEATRAQKIERIIALAPDVFIDDLPEVLADPAFPTQVERWLLSDSEGAEFGNSVRRFNSWAEIEIALRNAQQHL